MKKYILLIFIGLIQVLSYTTFAQGGETVAAAAASPVTLPFTANGTTVGKTDNYNDVTTGYTGFNEITGPDWLYYFCATSTTPIIANISFTPDPVSGIYPSITIWDGNPNTTGNLIAYNTAYGIDASTTGQIFTPISGQCYYVMVDNWPTPNGFPYTITIETQPTPPASPLEPSCSNMGFEDGNFTGWQGTWSNIVNTSPVGSLTPTYTPFYFNTSSTQHTITSGAGVDPVAGFPVVCPGQGNYSLRLGDGLVGEKGGATIQQKFSVTTSNALFTYNYAVIVEDGSYGGGQPHDGTNQPFFKVEILNSAGVEIPCGQYLVTGGAGIPGFTQVPNSGVYYRAWTPVFVDLSAYIGSFVTVKYTVNDCSLGAHSCYAYIDAACSAMTVPATTFICPNGTGTVTSPLTGTAYSWTIVGNPTVLGTSQSLSVSPTVPTTYQCVITNASGCSTTLTFPVDFFPPATVTCTSQSICPGSSTTLTATGSSATGTFSWSPSGGNAATTTALSPASATTYTCTYTDPNGCGASGTGSISMNPLPPAPTTAPVTYCKNDVAVALTATPLAGNTLNWYGTNAVGGTSSPTAPTPITTASGPTTYYVSQTDGVTGCEGPRASLVVTVNALPTITVNSPTVCPNATAILTASGGVSYSWDSGASTTNPYTVTPAVTTTYTVAGTDANGCVNTATSTVTVQNGLAVSVNSPTICDGGTAVLTASGATTYSWDQGASIAVSTTNPYSVTPTVTTTYTVTGTTNGCTGTATATVTVNPIPTTTAGSNTPICAATALNLTATSSAGATYSWTGPNAFASALQNPTIASATTAASGTYTVTITANGCSSTSTVTVVVNPIPTTTASSNSPICDGTSLNLTATASGVAGSTYNWTGPNGFVSAVQNPTLAGATVAASGVYTVTVDANGCSSTSTTNVTVNAIPTTTPTSNGPICNGVTLNLTTTASGVAGSTYSWTGPNGFASAVQNPSIPAATTAATGAYTVTVTANGCTSNSVVNVVVNQTPSTTAGSTPVCQGSDLNLTATASGVAGSTYSWTGPNGFSSAVQNPTVTAATTAATGAYTVTVTANSCSSTSVVNATVNAPITPDISISPNTICAGSIAPILQSSSLDNPPITGTWNPSVVDVNATGSYTFTPNAGQCALPVTGTVTVNPMPVLVITNPPDICVPGTVDLTAVTVTAGSSASTLSYWQDAAATIPLASPSSVSVGGTYFIESTSLGCSTVSPVTVTVHSLPIADFTVTPNEVSNLHPYTIMQNNSIGAVTYWWDFGDDSPSSTSTNPDHTFPDQEAGTYTITLVATSQFGCVDTAYASVKVNEELIFYVPNTFTPDKDQYNEMFSPVFTSGFDPYDFTLYIFDRWGELIFESHDASIGWHGTYGPDHIQCQDDTYTWKIVFKLKSNNQHKVYVGHVNLLR